jgi:drug/metabolite transporter (DMT)-like permease
VQLSATAAWAWIPIVIWAAFAQTIRNAAQRTLTAEVGTLPATLVRFLYGLPVACLWLWVVHRFIAPGHAAPDFPPAFFGWIALGALSQLGATALLLLAMKERNFIVSVTYSKTEVLQVAFFGALLLQELPGWLTTLAMLGATAGVVLLSLPSNAKPGDAGGMGWLSRAALYGLGSGALFALASVGYRGASLTLPGVSAWVVGAWSVVIAQTLQSLLLGGYLAVRSPKALWAVFGAWRLSSVAGGMGALASIGWLTATAMRPAADVRTLGLVEVFFSYLVSRRIFKEKLKPAERAGLLLVAAGLVVVCAQL